MHSSGHRSGCCGYHGVEARPRPGGAHCRTGSTRVNSQAQPGRGVPRWRPAPQGDWHSGSKAKRVTAESRKAETELFSIPGGLYISAHTIFFFFFLRSESRSRLAFHSPWETSAASSNEGKDFLRQAPGRGVGPRRGVGPGTSQSWTGSSAPSCP